MCLAIIYVITVRKMVFFPKCLNRKRIVSSRKLVLKYAILESYLIFSIEICLNYLNYNIKTYA